MSQATPTLKEIEAVVKKVVEKQINGSEKRQEVKLKKLLREELNITEQRIYHGIGDAIDNSILTQLDEKADKKEVVKLDKRVTKLEQNQPILHHIKK